MPLRVSGGGRCLVVTWMELEGSHARVRALRYPVDWVARQQQVAYLAAVVAIAEHSEGEVIDPPRTVHDCPDHEDNLILDLAAEVGTFLIVSNDVDLISMSPWRGTPIVTPEVFRQKVDGMRRHARRRR